MKDKSRRRFNTLLAKAAILAPAATLLSHRVHAEGPPMVDPESATAKALQYAIDTPEPGKNCAGCVLYSAQEGDESGACSIFPGSSVPANAWCTAYVAKP